MKETTEVILLYLMHERLNLLICFTVKQIKQSEFGSIKHNPDASVSDVMDQPAKLFGLH